MKTLFTVLALTMMTQAQASRLSVNSSWSEILDTKNVQTQAATVAMQAGDATSFISVLDVCALNESQYMTVEEQNIWEVTRINSRTESRVVGAGRLVGSNRYVSMMKISSSEYRPIERTIEREQMVDVMFKIVGSSSSPVKLFSKKFVIPDCQ